MTASAAIKAATPDKASDGGHPDLLGALAGLCYQGKLTASALGYALRKWRRKVVGGLRLDSAKERGERRWWVEAVRPHPPNGASQDDQDDQDDVSSPGEAESNNSLTADGGKVSSASSASSFRGGPAGSGSHLSAYTQDELARLGVS